MTSTMHALPPLYTLGIQLLVKRRGKVMMHRPWRWKLVLLFRILPVLLSLGGQEAAAQAQPAAGKAKVDRLVMGLITPYLDYIRPWLNGTADHNIQHDPAFE